jgi:anti-anti-sigma factor
MTPANEITVTAQGEIILARVECANMEARHAQALVAELSAVGQTPALPVVLDLSPVTRMPSMCIGVLVTLLKRFQGTKQRFILAGLQPPVRQTLTICRLDKLFELADSVDEAKARLHSR